MTSAAAVRRVGSIEASGSPSAVLVRLPGVALALVPGALTVYLAFGSGGFLAERPASAAIVLLLLLLGRLVFVARPGRGFNALFVLCAAALAGFAAWTLLSGSWSDAPSRALTSFDRDLLYLLVFVACGAAGGESWRLRWLLRGLALAAVIVCLAALVTRLLPTVWPITYESISPRLSYPIGYWNGLGLLAALGTVVCFGLTCTESEPVAVRILSAAAIPLLSATVLLTLSRGAIATGAVGLFAFALAGHPRALLSGLGAVLPTSVVAVLTSYNANLVLNNELTRNAELGRDARVGRLLSDAAVHAGQAQGHHVALILALCAGASAWLRALLLRADGILGRIEVGPRERRRLLIGGAAIVVVGLVVAAVVVDLPKQYDRFVKPATASQLLARAKGQKAALTVVNNDERIAQWDVGLDEFKTKPLTGRGAGTYELTWAQNRPDETVLYNSALYPEVLSELGIVGLLLLMLAIVGVFVGAARRLRGRSRPLYATVLAVSITWALAVATDYYWELPAITLWFFALGGVALARPRPPESTDRYLAWPPRILLGAGLCALILLAPVRLSESQSSLETASVAWVGQRCDVVDTSATDSMGVIGDRPQPYALLAGCALQSGQYVVAIQRAQQAVAREPNNALLQYDLAVALARNGLDPSVPARKALRLDPHEAVLIDSVPQLVRARGAAALQNASASMQIQIPPST